VSPAYGLCFGALRWGPLGGTMTQPQTHKRYRCRFCGYVFNAWLPAAKRPNGAMLLYHLSQLHPDEIGPYLDRMRTEDIGTVAAEAYEVVEEQDEAS
jgi:hypothetical protein